MQSNLRKNRNIILITMIIFALPVVVSTTLYMTGWRPSGTVNYGTLITPAKLLEDRTLQELDGKAIKLSQLRGKWTMFYFGPSACDEPCAKQLFFMRQTHLSLGRDFDRMQRVFVLQDDKSAATLNDRFKDYEGMIILKDEPESVLAMQKEFGADEIQEKENIFLVDPQGFLMMRYMPDSDPKAVRKDLDRLLKYSGDNR